MTVDVDFKPRIIAIVFRQTVEEMLRTGGPDWQRVLSYVENIYRHFEMWRLEEQTNDPATADSQVLKEEKHNGLHCYVYNRLNSHKVGCPSIILYPGQKIWETVFLQFIESFGAATFSTVTLKVFTEVMLLQCINSSQAHVLPSLGKHQHCTFC